MAEFDGEGAIVRRAVTGNAEAVDLGLEELYDRFGEPLFRYAYSITHSADDAEDAVQEVFFRIARKPVILRKPNGLKAYMFTAARNAAYTVLRSRRRGEELTESIALEQQTNRAEDPADAIIDEFSHLPPEQCEVLVLKIFEDMTFDEIARAMGTSANTAASRYRYAIDKLRSAVKEHDDG